MDHRHVLIAVLLVMLSGASWAGFAQLAPPPGWSGAAGGYSMPSASNAATFSGGFSGPGGSMNIGGKAVTMPAAYRFAANAGRFAATAMFRNPAWWAASAAIAYIADQCIGVVGGVWKITCGPGTGKLSDGNEYRVSGTWASHVWYSSPQESCTAEGAYYGGSAVYSGSWPGFCQVYRANGQYVNGGGYEIRASSCPSGWYKTDQGCTQAPQPLNISEADFVERISPKPIPADLPKVIPGPWPVEIPVINPTPGSNPQPQPFVVPDGLPRPVPNTDPQQWEQPGIRISPAPTPSAPWQVDIQPIKTPVPGPEASPEPYTPGEEAPESKPDDTTDLCKLNPDILACQKLDTPEDVEIPNTEKTITVSPDSGWGPTSGTCPAPKVVSFMRQSIPIPLDAVCMFASGLRPVVLAMAWLAAALMLVGVARRGE